MRIAVIASNVKSLGGIRLLHDTTHGLNKNYSYCFFVRSDVSLDVGSNNRIIFSEKSLKGIYLHLKRIFFGRWDCVLSFGNFPVPFYWKRQVLFLQNRLLISNESDLLFPLITRMVMKLKREFFRFSAKSCFSNLEFIVQSESMRRSVFLSLGRKPTVSVVPFVGARQSSSLFNVNTDQEYDFFYPASGEPHKNHINLIDAWKVLAANGAYPKLVVTVDKDIFPKVAGMIERSKSTYNLNIVNLGAVKEEEVQRLFLVSRALIYPSFSESLGLPLVDARVFGSSIVASELDYVWDICEPDITFDPSSSASIARSVSKFLKLDIFNVANIKSVEDFFDSVCK